VIQETSAPGEADAANINNVLRSIDSASLAELMSIWRSRVPEEGSGSPALFRCLAERILAHGEPLLAYDVVTARLATWPKEMRLRQLQGLALARSGATERANAILQDLRHEAQTDEETLGMLARDLQGSGRQRYDGGAARTIFETRRRNLRRSLPSDGWLLDGNQRRHDESPHRRGGLRL
jgi:predicted Zn-dependent protease